MHDATVPDAYCYNALFRMHVKSETSLQPALGTLRGLHAAVISRGITPVNSERFQDLLKVAFGQGYTDRALYGS